MNKIFCLLVFVCFINFQSFAQIDDIKQSAKTIRGGGGGGRESGYHSSGNGDLIFLFFFLFRDITISTVDLLVTHHRFLLDNKDIYPEAFSFDYMPDFSINQNNQYTMMQRVRGTYGVWSTDLRLNYLAEVKNFSAQSYKTIDWQIVQFSTFPSPNFNLRFGTGLLYDNYSGLSYNEHMLGMEFYLLKHQYWLSAEGRFAFDYLHGADVYDELNLRGNYMFYSAPHINTYLTAGYLYQNYYSAAEISSFQFGLSVNLH